MKKIFTSVAIFVFGFSTLSAQLRVSHHGLQESKFSGSNVTFTHTCNQLHLECSGNDYSIAGVTKLNATGNSMLAFPLETNNFFRRWMSEGSIQTSRNLTMALSFTDDVNYVSILFSLPIKKFKFL